ncbi:hypothetical protein DFQ27_006306 [Actinomortierella ambigua]|uniref:Uncharacterized protein n=1 Tax=Actinomortierella ambigua TaxID=1343610 RepID=A0A9P6U0M9_9FUNG|nr:hypothetical protein DFQ27_006306 [Actinomortierella ambigua]
MSWYSSTEEEEKEEEVGEASEGMVVGDEADDGDEEGSENGEVGDKGDEEDKEDDDALLDAGNNALSAAVVVGAMAGRGRVAASAVFDDSTAGLIPLVLWFLKTRARKKKKKWVMMGKM